MLKLEKFDELVACFEKLPGVGKKSAQKYAYHVALGDSFAGLNLAHCIEDAVHFLRHCSMCGGVSQNEICDVCSDFDRDRTTLCVVESAKDIMVIERLGSYDGLYFVFSDAQMLGALRQNIEQNGVKEIIFALTPGIGSDATMLYLESELQDTGVEFTKIAQGVPTGVSLENIDILSLTKAIKDRNSV